MGNVIKEG